MRIQSATSTNNSQTPLQSQFSLHKVAAGKPELKEKRSKPVFHRPFYVILRSPLVLKFLQTAGSEKHGLKFSMSTPYSVPLKAFSPHRTFGRGRCEPILKLRRIGGLNQGVTPKKIRGTFIRREPGQKLN